MKFKASYLVGVCIGTVVIAADVYFLWGTRWFWTIAIVVASLSFLQFWIDFFRENERQKQVELQFIEFMRSLVESIKSGVSIPKSIMNVSKKDFGALNPHLKKLSNQIEWGIPTRKSISNVQFGYK